MPRHIVPVKPPKPVRICKTCSVSIEARPLQAIYCEACADEQKKSRHWDESTYRSKGFVEVLGTIRFKKPGTKERLQMLAAKKNKSIWELIQEWAWR